MVHDDTLIKAIPHIRLQEANAGKLAELDAVWEAYQDLCQTYVTHFCTIADPDGLAAFVYDSPLSDRWQRVAVQQAAGIAKSWRTNRRTAANRYVAHLAWYNTLPEDKQATQRKPTWKEWSIPELRAVCIQANANVVTTWNETPSAVELTEAHDSQFDYWLQIATLTKRKPIYLPVKLSDYHRQKLAGQTPNRSVTLNRRKGVWWLTLTIDLPKPAPTQTNSVRGIDIGIHNFVTDNRGQRYGSFADDLAKRHQQDRVKRQRKAKLRACLAKKRVAHLPSTSSASGQRLARRVRQDINRAVNLFLDDAQQCSLVMEDLDVAGMRFKARRMNAYLYASNLAHIPKQLLWGAAKRGIPVVLVNPAYSSQECPRCHYADRANRPNQQTFCCQVCGYTGHADTVAATNVASRYQDAQLAHCRSLDQVKKLLLSRHATCKANHGYP